MADRREELRRKRLEAEAQRGSSQQRRLILGYVVAGLLAAAVVVGLVVVIASGDDDGPGGGGSNCENAHVQANSGFTLDLELDCREGTPPPAIEVGDLAESAKLANCELREELEEEGNTHIPADAPDPKWKTNPPTSGDHDGQQLADGAYAETPNPRNALHALEHGRIEIQYSSELSEEEQLALKGAFDESPDAIAIYPNDEMPYTVAVTAWTALLGCNSYDAAVLDAIRNFRDRYRGRGPEAVPMTTG
jgi:hypothetical protein